MSLLQQDRCLICDNLIPANIGWLGIFLKEEEQLLCKECEGRLTKIEGNTCKICGRPFQNIAERFRVGELCHDCIRWEEDPEWGGYLDHNDSLFLYNDFLKEVIAMYKFRGDYCLARIFTGVIREKLKTMEADLFVPIPLSKERLYERGFNQAKALLYEAEFPPTEILTRIHTEKQSKKTRLERIHLSQVFQLDPIAQLEGKRIILIDDIYTTGSTLRHAAKLLKQAGAASVRSLTVGR